MSRHRSSRWSNRWPGRSRLSISEYAPATGAFKVASCSQVDVDEAAGSRTPLDHSPEPWWL